MHAEERLFARYLDGICPLPDAVNVCVLVNATPEQCAERTFEEGCDYARRVAKKYNDACGRECVSVLAARMDGSVSMGRVRRILMDAVIAYSLQNGIVDPALICNDIDQIRASPTYVSDLSKRLSRPMRPTLVAGRVGYGYIGNSPIGLPRGTVSPELYVFNRIQDAINACTRTGAIGREPKVWPEGANMAFSAMAYCCAGGFDPRRQSGEDDALGHDFHDLATMSEIKGSAGACGDQAWQPPEFVNSAWIITDPRRVLAAMLDGRTGIEAWAWRPFVNTPGHASNTALLLRLCEAAPHLISSRHLDRFAPTRRDDVWEFITSRLAWHFFRSVLFDGRARDSKELNAVADAFGLSLTDVVLNRDIEEFRATVAWRYSPILRDLARLSRSARPSVS